MSPACAPRGELAVIVKNMAKGLLSILGFINESFFDWKILVVENEKLGLK